MGTPSVDFFLDFMPETVTITPWTSQTVSGAPVYGGTARTHRARIEMKNRRVIDKSGQEIVSRGRIYMATTTVPDTRDKITLPAGYTPTNPPIIAVNPQNDDTGTHHIVLDIG